MCRYTDGAVFVNDLCLGLYEISYRHRPHPTSHHQGGGAPWSTCVECDKVLWGFHLIEEDPI